jgi:hypothetical protein
MRKTAPHKHINPQRLLWECCFCGSLHDIDVDANKKFRLVCEKCKIGSAECRVAIWPVGRGGFLDERNSIGKR